jgi:HK97 family phage major capsid protein
VADAKNGSGPRRVKTIGEIFAESQQFKDFAKRVGNSGRGSCEPVQFKNITSGDQSGGAGIWSDRLQGVVEDPLRPLTIRGLFDTGTTESNLIEWVQEEVYTSNAAIVSEGAQKPESEIRYERIDVPVRTIAHWIHATRQVLADFKQLQTLINGRLTWGLKIAEEDQLLLGDGTGSNILGVIPQATNYDTSLDQANDTFIDTIRHAILQVRLAFYPASGIVLTPTDWHTIELMKDSQGRYLIANATGRLPPMLWGLPVVESDAMPDDQFLVGAFRMGATVFDREQASVAISTEDQDNFIKNMVTILCEERLALAVTRPAAFVNGSFPAGTTT